MERPSLSWDDHKSLIRDLQDNLDPKFHNRILAELMVGVAGQTYDGLIDTIRKIIVETGVQYFFMNHWMLLPNSPGAEPFYQQMHKLKWIKAYRVDKYNSINSVKFLEDAYQEIKDSRGIIKNGKEGNYIFSTSTMTFEEMMAIHMLQSSLIDLGTNITDIRDIDNFETVFNELSRKCLESAKQQFAEIQPLAEKYGFVVWGTYCYDRKQINFRWRIRDTRNG